MVGSSVKSNKTVVILTPGFPTDESDSLCIPALQDYVLCLHKTFPDLRIIVMAFQYPYKTGWYEWNGIKVFSAAGNNNKLFFRIRTWKIIWKQLKKVQNDFGIDILHSFWLGEATFIAQRFAKRKNIKHIATLFGQDALPSNRYLRLLNFKRMTVVANSEFTNRTFFNTAGRNANLVIHFGLNHELIDKTEARKRSCDIIGVGSFTKLKNYELFVTIINELVGDFPDLKAMIIGDGEMHSVVARQIQDYKLENTIDIKGIIPRAEVIRNLKQSKIFLHTSSYESSGTVFLESLSCGCELVCFNTGFVPASVKSHVCGDADEMIRILKSLLGQSLNSSGVKVPMIRESVKEFASIYEI
jgi:glycosyltransferase involved in cell wall biosynthesis